VAAKTTFLAGDFDADAGEHGQRVIAAAATATWPMASLNKSEAITPVSSGKPGSVG